MSVFFVSGPPQEGRAPLKIFSENFERVMGIEPTSSAWKADIISHYTTPATSETDFGRNMKLEF